MNGSEVQEDDMSTGTVPVGKKGKTKRATGINANPYDHNEGEDQPALVNAALWNMKDIYQTIMAGEAIQEDNMFSYGDLIQYLDMTDTPGEEFYDDFIDTISTAVSKAQPGGFAGQGDAVVVDKNVAPQIKTLYQKFKAATAKIKGITEEQFEQLAEKKDACYYKVKSRYKVWPSAYASGALVRCRKVGAANWGNKSKKK